MHYLTSNIAYFIWKTRHYLVPLVVQFLQPPTVAQQPADGNRRAPDWGLNSPQSGDEEKKPQQVVKLH